jgi:hypothetical protein
VLANLIAKFLGQIGYVTISWEEGLASDHMALLFDISPLDSIALILAPSPNRYKAEPENRDLWVEAFIMLLPPCLPYVPPYSIVPNDPLVTCYRVLAYEHLNQLMENFNNAIETPCKKTLEPKCAPDP